MRSITTKPYATYRTILGPLEMLGHIKNVIYIIGSFGFYQFYEPNN